MKSTVTRRDVLAAAAATGAGLVSSSCSESPAPHGQAQVTPATDIAPLPAGVVPVTLDINGKRVELRLEPRVTLLDALREYAGLTGSKKGCDHGQCGACTVLVDSRRIDSCLSLAIMHQGRKITTIEGLASGDDLHPVQAAFVEHDAFQCGYCTPGQICSAVGLLNEAHARTDAEIREQMAGNICRCGAYRNIVAAVRQAMSRSA
jgi:xanthine dehydrogenase YagT iron-sulfur-binding subunit